MGQTYLTLWGVEVPPHRPTGKPYVGRIVDVSKTCKYVCYVPFYVSTHEFWVKVPSEYRHELIGSNRVKVVMDSNGKFHFHSAWYEESSDKVVVVGDESQRVVSTI